MRYSARTILLTVFMVVAATAFAADVTLITETTAEQMQGLLAGSGYATSIQESGSILWKIDGMNAILFVADDKQSVQFYTAFAGGETSLMKVNEWNKTRRYSRSYIDDEGDPVLELDLDLVGGVTPARIEDFLLTCQLSYRQWYTDFVE
jgi:hypothetical protein